MRTALVATAAGACSFASRLPFQGASPQNHDSALLLARVHAMLERGESMHFGEIWTYRPLSLSPLFWAFELLPLQPTPENLLLAGNLFSLAAVASTAALLVWWLARGVGLPLLIGFTAAITWTTLPVVACFAGETLSAVPAMFPGTLAFIAGHVASTSVSRKRCWAYGLLSGTAILLAVLTREDWALILFPCVLMAIHADVRAGRQSGRPTASWRRIPGALPRTSALFAGLIATTAVWITLEATVIHPGKDLSVLLVPQRGVSTNLVLDRWVRLQTWRELLATVAWCVTVPVVVLSLVGAVAPSRWYREGLRMMAAPPLVLWAVSFLALYVQVFVTAPRFLLPLAMPLFLLALRGVLLLRSASLSVLALLAISGIGWMQASETVRQTSRLPHAHALRAQRLRHHTGPDDMVVCMAQDHAYAKWWIQDRIVIPFWQMLPRQKQQRLWSTEEGHVGLSAGRDATELLQELRTATILVGSTGGRLLVVSEKQLLAAFQGLSGNGVRVDIIETIPPGSSRSQYDPFGWLVGRGAMVSADEEFLLALSAVP